MSESQREPRAPLSVVIPTLDAGLHLPGCAEALLPGVTGGLIRELVVSDGGSQDETLAVARSLGARVVEGAAGRGAQIARGVASAAGEWVLVLHGDTRLSPGWEDAVWRHMGQHPDRAGFFRLAFRGGGWRGRLVAAGANLRSRFLGLPYGDQGFLVARQVLEAAGGVPDVPLMEDVMLARAFRGRLAELDAVAATSPERYERAGWARRVVRNFWTLFRFMAGVAPDRLAEGYQRR